MNTKKFRELMMKSIKEDEKILKALAGKKQPYF